MQMGEKKWRAEMKIMIRANFMKKYKGAGRNIMRVEMFCSISYHLFYERLTGIHHFPYISTDIYVLALPDIDTYYANIRGIYVIGGDRKAVRL